MNPTLYRGYRLLGWGFVFEVIDFRVFYFDILPDFVGYIMIATALQQLGTQHGIFKNAKWLAIGMIALSLPHVLMASNVTFESFGELPLYFHIYSEGLLACHVLIVYWICQGLRDIAHTKGHTDLFLSVVYRRNVYMGLAIIQLMFYPFLFNAEVSWVNLLLLIGVLQFLMEVLFIRLPFRFSNMCIRNKLMN